MSGPGPDDHDERALVTGEHPVTFASTEATPGGPGAPLTAPTLIAGPSPEPAAGPAPSWAELFVERGSAPSSAQRAAEPVAPSAQEERHDLPGSSPTEALPVVPAQALPAEALPARTVPPGTVPPGTVQPGTVQPEAVQPEAVPVDAVGTERPPVEDAQGERMPVERMPGERMPGERPRSGTARPARPAGADLAGPAGRNGVTGASTRPPEGRERVDDAELERRRAAAARRRQAGEGRRVGSADVIEGPVRERVRSRRDVRVVRGLRSRRLVRRIDVLTVFRVSVAFYLLALLTLIIAGFVVWNVADAFGLIHSLQNSIRTLFSLKTFTLHSGSVLFYAVVIGGVLCIAGALLTTLAATIYNLLSDVVGGIEVVVVTDVEADPRR